MNDTLLRRVGSVAVGLIVATAAVALALPLAPSVQAVDGNIVLSQGMMGGPGVSEGNGNYDQTFAAVQIDGISGNAGKYELRSSDSNIPLSWEYYPGNTVKGTGSFYLNGSYDSTTAAVTGRFTYENKATGTIKGSFGDLALDFSMTWTGDVTGTIDSTVATLSFSGTDTTVCTLGGDNCGLSGTQMMTVWFTVAGSMPTTLPSAEGENVVTVSGAVGDVYVSPASEADLETSQRTWQLVKPGDRIALEAGVMLRTGQDGSLKIQFSDTSRIRLQPSTLFSVKKIVQPGPNQIEVYTRLYQGIADFYMHKWAEDHKKFEVEVDRAIVSIKGTTWTMAVTDAAAVVTVSEGVVALTDKSTGQTIDVNPGEQATVDAAGTRKAAAPSTPGQPDATGGQGSSPADPSPSSDSGGPPIAIIAAIVAGLGVVMVLAAALLLRRPAG